MKELTTDRAFAAGVIMISFAVVVLVGVVVWQSVRCGCGC